jgi:ABC-2 type transport system ATP-binding protein
MKHPYAIKVENVSKSFKLPFEKHSSLKSLLVNFRRRGYEKQEVLRSIEFEIKPGEFFGIVGRNGSGKSTLLKLISGIYSPDNGEVHIRGRLTPFIELGVGFNPELTGRENVYLNGALLGFDRRHMDKLYEEIVSFAELERFMDQKLKNYSSGMQVRLAFSIAIQAKSDILVLDEVLAVGDADFQQKCYTYFSQLKQEGKTVVLVTHDMSAVRRFCTRGILIDKGNIVKEGSPMEIAEVYEELNLRNSESRLMQQNDKERTYLKREGNGDAVISEVETFNAATGSSQNTFNAGESIGVRITCHANKLIQKPAVGFIFQDDQRNTIFATNNLVLDLETKDINEGQDIVCEVVVDNVFTNGEYSITCAIQSTDLSVIYDRIEFIHYFILGGHVLEHAKTHAKHTMAFTYK